MTTDTFIRPRPIAGFAGFAMGAVALLLVLVHFWVGPLAPQQRSSVTIGETAAEIRQSAVRKLKGLPPAQPLMVPAAPWDTDRILKLVAATMAGLAVIASAAGLIRRETWQPAVGGIALGTGAIVFQLFTWAILVLAGALIMFAIIQNISSILGE